MVFNTSHTGYQEIVTDPSYVGQLVTFTVSEVGNYGIHLGDEQSARPAAAGFIARRVCKEPSSWRSEEALSPWLSRYGVVGIEAIDTRRLVRVLRSAGAQTGIIDTSGASPKALVERAKSAPGMEGQDLATGVSTREAYEWTLGSEGRTKPKSDKRVVVVDFGVKRGILRQLVDIGCSVTVVPSRTSARDVLARHPDGVLLSNGPGDPAAVAGADKQAAELLGKVPLMGLCLGHQLLSLALGGRTYKLKFGHRGANHPVRETSGGHIDLTSQNHGFSTDEASIKGKAIVTHVNLNDGTVEGIASPEARMFAVQYHPEDSPGPHDSRYLFRRFVQMMEDGTGAAAATADSKGTVRK
ncbi:MAG: glutamine-hydrolyzing carbamoyl-phosphate synthase small subunit [Myxococcales bacterium]